MKKGQNNKGLQKGEDGGYANYIFLEHICQGNIVDRTL